MVVILPGNTAYVYATEFPDLGILEKINEEFDRKVKNIIISLDIIEGTEIDVQIPGEKTDISTEERYDGNDKISVDINSIQTIQIFNRKQRELVDFGGEKFNGLQKIRAFFNKKHRTFMAHRSRRKFVQSQYGFILFLLDELMKYDSIKEFTEEFSSPEELNHYLRKLYLSSLKDIKEKDIEEVSKFDVAAEDPMDENAVFLKMMREKPKNFMRSYNLSKKVKAIDRKNLIKQIKGIFRRKKKEMDTGDELDERTELEKKEDNNDELVLFGATSMLHLSDFKYRSNLSMRSGKFIVTNQRIITYRRRLSFLPSLPFFAFVRPNNRVVALTMNLISRLKYVIPTIKAILRTFGAPLLGFFLIFWDELKLPEFTLPTIPGISIDIQFLINFAIEKPEFIAVFAGLSGVIGRLLYILFKIIFMRSKAVTVVTPEMVVGLSTLDQFRRGKSKDPTLVLRPLGTSKLPRSDFGFRIKPSSRPLVNEMHGIAELNIATLGMLAVSKWYRDSDIK